MIDIDIFSYDIPKGMIRKQTKHWKTKDGRKIRICDMEDDHLLNTIKLLHRHALYSLKNICISYMSYPYPSGDGARDAFDREFDYWNQEGSWEDCALEIMEDLVCDAARRELDVECLWNNNYNEAVKLKAIVIIMKKDKKNAK